MHILLRIMAGHSQLTPSHDYDQSVQTNLSHPNHNAKLMCSQRLRSHLNDHIKGFCPQTQRMKVKWCDSSVFTDIRKYSFFLALYILAKLIMVYVNFYMYRNPQGISSVHLVSHYTNWHCTSCCDIYTKEIRYCQVLFVVLEYYHCMQFFVVILQYVLGKILFHLKPVFKKKALYLSVSVFSTKVLTGDTIFYVS